MPADRLRRWLDSERFSYGLRRDLKCPHRPPPARVPIRVRPLKPSDIPALLAASGLAAEAIYDRMDRREFIEAGIEKGYVAVTRSDIPCYVQWLIGPSQNLKIQRYFGDLLPFLHSDEVLLEQAFTLEPFRGLGIMPCAMSQIAEIGLEHGARWAITFVSGQNVSALKGCKRAGFRPYLIRRERWRLLKRRISFHHLPADTPYPFDEPLSGTTACLQPSPHDPHRSMHGFHQPGLRQESNTK